MQNIETEVKIVLKKEKVAEIYAIIGNPDWNLQRNFIFNLEKGFLRLRYEQEKAFLTVKGERKDEEYNSRPETESEIPLELFNSLSKVRGNSDYPVYYEKLRASAKFGKCTVCLDNLNGNYFVEIEGNEGDIRKNRKNKSH